MECAARALADNGELHEIEMQMLPTAQLSQQSRRVALQESVVTIEYAPPPSPTTVLHQPTPLPPALKRRITLTSCL